MVDGTAKGHRQAPGASRSPAKRAVGLLVCWLHQISPQLLPRTPHAYHGRMQLAVVPVPAIVPMGHGA